MVWQAYPANHVGNASQHQSISCLKSNSTTCQTSMENHVAWCASLLQEGKEKGIAIARYVILHDEVGVAEFAITVLDDYQGQGIGYELIKKLIRSAKANDVNMLIGHIAPGNKRMLNLCKRFDASIQTEKSSSVIALISVKNDYS
ncbi:GNAT family N-acetyltransferase [Solemya velum gill symbiont]|uniref:GNAT family N-acetyltransferase n=1 Tax=Solemya velum gill symbiont TaxID=2340 RepID=UPI00351D2F62